MDVDDDPWLLADEDSERPAEHNIREQEWSKISEAFTNSGYREGIVAGKEASLQQGFDDGFASVGAPLGRQLGLLRGTASALLSYLTSSSFHKATDDLEDEARAIAAGLANVRLSDIAPRDLEAEQHAREHLEQNSSAATTAAAIRDEPSLAATGEMEDRTQMEQLEDMLNQLTAGSAAPLAGRAQRPTMQDVENLRERLGVLTRSIGLDVSV